MTCYHTWGDSWPHWQELYQAEIYIRDYVYKWSRCHLSSKEKYGTLRYEYIYPPFHRKHWAIKLPFFEKSYHCHGFKLSYPIYLFYWQTSFIYRTWVRLGKWVFKRAVKNACLRFPNVKKEILNDYNLYLD